MIYLTSCWPMVGSDFNWQMLLNLVARLGFKHRLHRIYDVLLGTWWSGFPNMLCWRGFKCTNKKFEQTMFQIGCTIVSGLGLDMIGHYSQQNTRTFCALRLGFAVLAVLVGHFMTFTHEKWSNVHRSVTRSYHQASWCVVLFLIGIICSLCTLCLPWTTLDGERLD